MMSSHPEANFQTEKNPETGAMGAAIELRGEQNDSRCEQCDTLAAKLTKIAEAMNELAWIYSEDENSLESALVFSEAAVELAPENSNLLDTQAMLSFQLKEYKQAVAVMEKAVSLLENKPNHSQEELIKYQQKLAEYRKKLPLLGN